MGFISTFFVLKLSDLLKDKHNGWENPYKEKCISEDKIWQAGIS